MNTWQWYNFRLAMQTEFRSGPYTNTQVIQLTLKTWFRRNWKVWVIGSSSKQSQAQSSQLVAGRNTGIMVRNMFYLFSNFVIGCFPQILIHYPRVPPGDQLLTESLRTQMGLRLDFKLLRIKLQCSKKMTCSKGMNHLDGGKFKLWRVWV